MALIASKHGEDTETGDLFAEDAQSPAPPPSPTPEQPESQGERKSNQDYRHEESLEGLNKKYADTSQGIEGRQDAIVLPNGEEVEGIWKLVDAFSISPSHDPMTFRSTKGFPRAEGGGSANVRDYLNEPEAQKGVIEAAGEFDGRALGYDSAVVVTKDGVVISGNNRTMSSQLAARKGTDKKYLAVLLRRCSIFGFTPEQVQSFEHPRVVFEIDSSDYSPEHFEKYNADDKKGQSEEARIVKYSKIVKPEILKDIVEVYRRYQFSFGNVYANPQAIQEIINCFIKGGILSKAESPKYFDGQKISSIGKQFIQEYTLGAVLKEPITRALYGEGMGDIKVKVIDAAPLLLENWSMGSYAATEELNKAIEYAISYTRDLLNGTFSVPKLGREEAKALGAEGKFAHNIEAFKLWASQGDMFEDKDPVVLKLAGALVYSAPLFKSYLENLSTETASAAGAERETEQAGNDGLFGDISPDRSELLKKAVASWKRKLTGREILSLAVMGDGMDGVGEFIGSGMDDRIMKFTSADPQNMKAWKAALKLFKESFNGKEPRTPKDGKILMKAAKKMLKTGQIPDKAEFMQDAEEVVTGEPSGGGSQNARQRQPRQGGQQASGGSESYISGNDPVSMFEALKALFDKGKVTRDQLVEAFNKVVGKQDKAFARFMPKEGIKSARFNPLTAEQRSKIFSELYSVADPDDSSISPDGGAGGGGEPIESAVSNYARNDPIRASFRDFLDEIPSLTKVPGDPLKIIKEVLEEDHVCYLYRETLPNGLPYDIELHVIPGELAGDLWVIRGYDNNRLGAVIFMGDCMKWSLGETEKVDAMLVKEMARSVERERTPTGRDSMAKPRIDKRRYSLSPFNGDSAALKTASGFEGWFKEVGELISSGQKLPLMDQVVLSGMVADAVSSGALDLYRKTLKKADQLSHNPMAAVDDMAELPARGIDMLRGIKSARPLKRTDAERAWIEKEGQKYLVVKTTRSLPPGAKNYRYDNGEVIGAFDTEEEAYVYMRENGLGRWEGDIGPFEDMDNDISYDVRRHSWDRPFIDPEDYPNGVLRRGKVPSLQSARGIKSGIQDDYLRFGGDRSDLPDDYMDIEDLPEEENNLSPEEQEKLSWWEWQKLNDSENFPRLLKNFPGEYEDLKSREGSYVVKSARRSTDEIYGTDFGYNPATAKDISRKYRKKEISYYDASEQLKKATFDAEERDAILRGSHVWLKSEATMTDDDLQVVDWPDREEEEREAEARQKRYNALSDEEKRALRLRSSRNISREYKVPELVQSFADRDFNSGYERCSDGVMRKVI